MFRILTDDLYFLYELLEKTWEKNTPNPLDDIKEIGNETP